MSEWTCPSCGKTLTDSPTAPAEPARCPNCGTLFEIEESQEVTEAGSALALGADSETKPAAATNSGSHVLDSAIVGEAADASPSTTSALVEAAPAEEHESAVSVSELGEGEPADGADDLSHQQTGSLEELPPADGENASADDEAKGDASLPEHAVAKSGSETPDFRDLAAALAAADATESPFPKVESPAADLEGPSEALASLVSADESSTAFDGALPEPPKGDSAADAGVAAGAGAPIETATTSDQSRPVDQSPAHFVAAATTDSGRPTDGPTARSQTRGISPLLFLLLLSYASAVTIGFAYLVWKSRQPNPHQLESLPDLVPPMKNGRIGFKHVAVAASMPPGHTLRLGESQRFGNVRVTPLRVTRGPLEFVHFSGDAETTRPHSDPVLKLWLRFENVSTDQTFAPLDRVLMFKRLSLTKPRPRVVANNFVCRLEEKRPDGRLVYMYDFPLQSEWDIVGQEAGRRLGPGESYETFVPSQEQGLDALSGRLVWRLQIRKGYHPESKRGVTTIIEIVFDASEIQDEDETVAVRMPSQRQRALTGRRRIGRSWLVERSA